MKKKVITIFFKDEKFTIRNNKEVASVNHPHEIYPAIYLKEFLQHKTTNPFFKCGDGRKKFNKLRKQYGKPPILPRKYSKKSHH